MRPCASCERVLMTGAGGALARRQNSGFALPDGAHHATGNSHQLHPPGNARGRGGKRRGAGAARGARAGARAGGRYLSGQGGARAAGHAIGLY